ncbi:MULTISPECIES: signal peptidase II [Terrabacteria group]|uniref:signal peptidase II n=1 Tax=Bacillati TaxID=1783272 RepID=UPI001C6E2D37|nr:MULTISPECIES: signal peptidase II [Terrabacteria group]MBW9213044.1 signal peptidase II [Trueperella sp. zg.1013]
MWLVISIVALDLISKHLASRIASSIAIIPGFLYLNFVKNFGMAWSFLSGQVAFLSLVAGVAVMVMMYYLIQKKPMGLRKIAVELMLAGAVGNLVDRLFLGYVRDFVDTLIFGYDFPIFNVADMALTIGVILLMYVEYKEGQHGKNKAHC